MFYDTRHVYKRSHAVALFGKRVGSHEHARCSRIRKRPTMPRRKYRFPSAARLCEPNGPTFVLLVFRYTVGTSANMIPLII